ncbi:signal anchor [Olea europaea subsp. europaea]|uniref:Signal anchor n=1 Tax=Olea europaea subsp. europaea TaxID=158383 RepID=A0A8S0VPN9_OLEEU|nr:signal anchor [Olea europaea subsp. europaea]
MSISLSLSPRQCPDRYAFRAGRNLLDKEFRYLKTVTVTAAVHRGFGCRLRCHQITNFLDLPALGRRQPPYTEKEEIVVVKIILTGSSCLCSIQLQLQVAKRLMFTGQNGLCTGSFGQPYGTDPWGLLKLEPMLKNRIDPSRDSVPSSI